MCAGAVIIRRQGPADTSDEDSEDEAEVEVEVEAAPEPVEPELPARDPLEVGNMVQSVGQAKSGQWSLYLLSCTDVKVEELYIFCRASNEGSRRLREVLLGAFSVITNLRVDLGLKL